MSYNIKELLVLTAEEKIILADLLYSSVNEELEENKNTDKWWSDAAFVDKLDKEFEDWKQGKVKGFTVKEVKAYMQEQKIKLRNK
jgi:hypothetical protein